MNGMAALNDLRRPPNAECMYGTATAMNMRTKAAPSIVDSERPRSLACFPDDDDLGVIAKNGEEGSLVRATAAAATADVLAASHDDCEIFI